MSSQILITNANLPFSQIMIASSGAIKYPDLIIGVNGPYWTLSDELWFNRDLPLLQDSGLNYIRLGIGVSHSYLDRCLEANIKVIATLDNIGLPDNLETFRNYVYNQVRSYRGKIEGWIVLNEVNVFYQEITKEKYLEILKVANDAIKEADPKALTITSNFAYADRAIEWIKELYQIDPNVNNYYDVVAVDPYCYRVENQTSSPDYPNVDMFGHGFWELEGLKELLNLKKDNSPIWIVEIGWPTSNDMSSIDEKTQADYIQRALEMSYNWGWIDRIYIYKWMDSVGERSMGILRNSFPYEKLSYYVVKNFINSLN